MYLTQLSLENFRSFRSSIVTFQPDLTILVGENNSGKSNTIDAIRLLTPPLSGRRDAYCQHTDIRFGKNTSFELTAAYTDLNDAQAGRLISASPDRTLNAAAFGISYDESIGSYPPRPVLWSGAVGRTPEPGSHDTIRHVYLPALRDAKHALASGNPTRIHALLRHFLKDSESEELLVALSRETDHAVLSSIGESVDVGLEALTGGVRQQSASLGFSKDEKLIDIARDLKFSLADQGIEPEDLSYSGHGYANLLYMATIAVELENVNNADLTLFLVEEPEAHLHPQLQSAVLAFLKERAIKSRDGHKDNGLPAGEIQVVVATHSPNLSASVPCQNIVFLRSNIYQVEVTESETEGSSVENTDSNRANKIQESAAVANLAVENTTIVDKIKERPETRAISLADLLQDPKERRKIDRYIDVTKASFLFGGRVFLVEGIAEALLIPVMAEYVTLRNNDSALRRFRSTTFVPIDGVDFQPYIQLLITPQNGVRIADRVVVVTDGDGPIQLSNGLTAGQNRQRINNELAVNAEFVENCLTFINDYSLETELLTAGNGEVLKQAYLILHPQSEDKWDEAVAFCGDELAASVDKLFESTRKGDFAQVLAQIIEDGSPITVPQYLTDAIRAIVR